MSDWIEAALKTAAHDWENASVDEGADGGQ